MTFWAKAFLIFAPFAQNHPKGKPLKSKELQERPLGLWGNFMGQHPQSGWVPSRALPETHELDGFVSAQLP